VLDGALALAGGAQGPATATRLAWAPPGEAEMPLLRAASIKQQARRRFALCPGD
jgi:hypothetical protein